VSGGHGGGGGGGDEGEGIGTFIPQVRMLHDCIVLYCID